MNARKFTPPPLTVKDWRRYLVDLEAHAAKLAAQGDLRAACMLHLIDLKRAGHSPLRTELAIPPEREGVRYVVPEEPLRSYARSAAGW